MRSDRAEDFRHPTMLIVEFNPVYCFAVGGPSLVWGIANYVSKRKRLRTWTRATAVVENVGRDRNSVVVRLRYTDAANQSRRCSLELADGHSVGLGSEISIAYNPQAPDQAFIADRKDMRLGAICAVVLGAVLVAAGVYSLFGEGSY